MNIIKKTSIASLLILIVFIFTGCNSNNRARTFNTDKSSSSETQTKADKVQVFTFHATRRCPTCIAIGKLSDETVKEYFQSELRDGKIEVREINIDLPENEELATKFQASGSALKINAIYNNEDHIEEDTEVWHLTSDSTQYKNYLKNKIGALFNK